MEALNCLLKKAICGGFLSACQVKGRGREGVEVSHLLFADDTLIFCEAGEEQMTFLCWVLMWFEAISGLKVNLDKSELILVGRVENVDDLVGKLGCKVGRLSSTYLGMPLGASFNSVAAWDGIKERFRKRGLNQVIREKYGEDRGGWLTREAREGHGVGFWKAIRNLGHLVSSRFSFVVGNGQWVSFWKDKWCGNSLLCNSFPSLYVLTANKEAWVSDLWAGSASGDLGGSWNPRFTRHFNNWELYEVEGLLRRLCEERVMLDEEDTVRWSMSNDGKLVEENHPWKIRAKRTSVAVAIDRNTSLVPQKSKVNPRQNYYEGQAVESLPEVAIKVNVVSDIGKSEDFDGLREIEGELDDPLKPESASVLLCMILKDGHFVALQEHNQITHSGGGAEGSVRVLVEGFEEDILRILMEIENRRCSANKSKVNKKGTMSCTRKDGELKKLFSTINYDGLAGREAEDGDLGRQVVMVPYEA
ncbi:hypothetical protein VitviT2T_021449 [Vitis vinifera]|uniref:Reverse transcriptase domain-containing protein n=1 Tax=Vitis vinifera TaxID=29760 RepID=A0ABY9D706_VITVI|nr:hypothetical protein VitviT2T_021449 [Vitis vinifera]